MAVWFFVSDLHGRARRWAALFAAIERERPEAVLLGGDLTGFGGGGFPDRIAPGFRGLRERLGDGYPRVLLILGNDDPRSLEADVRAGEGEGLWEYVHGASTRVGEVPVHGYAMIPPSPFLLKDWERYDVSRHVDPGCVSPEEGRRSVPAPARELRNATIAKDLERLLAGEDLARAVLLFHTPPWKTALDRAALDGRTIDHVPLDVHVGSIAVRRLIEARRPRVTLHGHIHESARLTGRWMDRIGATVLLGAAHDGPELALVRFDPERPETASRELV